MKNKWKFIGVISQVHDLENKRLVFETHEIENKEVVKTVVDMYNDGKDLSEIDKYLMDAECSQDEREIIVEAIYNYLNPYEFRAVMENGDDLMSLPLEAVNVDVLHELTAIGLYQNLPNGEQQHVLDITLTEIRKWKALFMGFRYK